MSTGGGGGRKRASSGKGKQNQRQQLALVDQKLGELDQTQREFVANATFPVVSPDWLYDTVSFFAPRPFDRYPIRQ